MDWKEYTEPDTQEKSRSRNKIKEKDSKLTSLILNLNCNPLKKREKVIEELGEMGEKAVFPLIEAIKSNSNVNIGAVIALVKIGEKAVPLLIEALKDYTVGERELATARQVFYDTSMMSIDMMSESMRGWMTNSLMRTIKCREGELVTSIKHTGTITGSIRESAAITLGKIKDTRGIGPLIETLQDEHWAVRWVAVDALGKIGDERVVHALENLLSKESSNAVKVLIKKVLPDLYDNAKRLSIEGLNIKEVQIIEGLSNMEKHVIQRSETKLIEMGEKAIRLLKIALKDKRERVRIRAIRILGEIGGTRPVEALIELLGSDRGITEITIETLGKTRDERAVGPLITMLKHQHQSVRDKARNALIKIGKKAIPQLSIALESNFHFIRINTVQVLGAIGDAEVVNHLIKALEDTAKDVRTRTAYELGHIGDRRAVEPLITMLNHENKCVNSNARNALIKIGKKAIPQLIIALEDRCYLLRKNVVKILGGIGGAKVVEHLIKALGDTAKEVRVEAAHMLGHRKEKKAIKSLIIALRDEQWEVGREAALALGEIGDKKAVEPLIELLQGNLLSVRRAACGLGELGDKQTEESLTKALENQQYRVRERAIETLGKIGVEATNLILDNEIGEVRRGAINALMKIRDERVIVPLIEALKEELKLFYKAKDYGDEYEYFLAEELEELSELIGHLGEKAVLPLIEVLKNNTRRDVKHFAVVYLGRSADVRAVQPLIEVLDNEDYVERRAVTRGLTSIGTIRGYEYIVEPIFQLLRMRGVKIRRGAIEVLGAIGAYLNEKDVNRVIDSLTKTLKDRYEEIRKVTVTSMNRLAWAAMLGSDKVVAEGVVIEREVVAEGVIIEGVVTSLIEALRDPKEDVRIEAVKALGEIGDKRAFILLHELLATESDNSVNREIIVAMEKLEKKE